MTRTIEQGRLRRALERPVVSLGGERYRVAGHDQETYDVDLDSPTPCFCRDAQIRGATTACLHELAARIAHLASDDAALIPALRELLGPSQPATHPRRTPTPPLRKSTP